MSQCKLWVYIEQQDGALDQASLELVGKAMELAAAPGWKVAGVLLGQDPAALAQELLSYGLDEVICAGHEMLGDYQTPAHTAAMAQAVEAHKPEVLLIGATPMGVDLAARLAARLRTGLSAHCVDLELNEAGELLAVVPGWGGSVMAKISCPKARPQMATVQPGVFDPPAQTEAKGEVIEFTPELGAADQPYRIVQKVAEPPAQSALDGAEVVVAGGWGLGSQKDWKLVEELATALSGAVGATRPPVDEGWASESQMIGTSGRSVSPKLYIGVAVSGNAHHLVGLKNPGLSVGINQDPKAAIFSNCDIGLVGDVKEIIPALLEELKG